MQEDGLDPDTVSPNGKWVGPFQQDAGYKGRYDPNENIEEFFNRLDAKRSSGGWSDNIWKNIFWLQQAPAASSADAAYATARKGYLMEYPEQRAFGHPALQRSHRRLSTDPVGTGNRCQRADPHEIDCAPADFTLNDIRPNPGSRAGGAGRSGRVSSPNGHSPGNV